MPNLEFFNNSQIGQAETIKFVTNVSSPTGVDPLESQYLCETWLTARCTELAGLMEPGAIHDSDERCDAPKCQPETRVAVQDDLYDWILDGDGASESEHPKKIKWVTGPAGCGKTAIMGSLAGRCAANGVLGATFFFASWSASVGRRRKTAFVTTLASQLAEHREDLKDAISNAIEKNPSVFKKNLHAQMELLVLAPLREVALQSDRPQLRGAIIIDGVDECEAEQYHDGSRANPPPARTNEQDQLEILEVLQAASSDPSFPFRILIASRPERVFRSFFDPRNTPTPFSHKLDLHEDYNADADITLFFEVQFNRLCRRYNFPPSWPPPGTIQALVKNASGQFIYAATVIRILETAHRDPPEALLKAILATGATLKLTSNPLEQLDALYSHILESSPDPLRSVRWICSIKEFNEWVPDLSWASNVHLFLQTDPESNEAEHLLGNLHSLIRIPPPSDQATTKYDFYHKSLLDFLEDPTRCGNQQKLYVEKNEIHVFMWDRFNQACMRGCNTQFSFPDSFLRFLVDVPVAVDKAWAIPHSKAQFTPASAAWWVSLAIAHEREDTWWIFRDAHTSCSWYRCKPACRIWSRSILRRLGSPTWIAPGLIWRARDGAQYQPTVSFNAFDRLVQKAIADFKQGVSESQNSSQNSSLRSR